ncbi:MAG: alpha/beta hydrolase [Leptolinea sp.]
MNKKAVELFYEEIGQGTPIVFLHGFPLDHTTWQPVARLLKDEARCILPDLRGHGNSPVIGTEATIQLMAEDVTLLMDKLEIPQAIIVGHSMGGYVALQLAHSFPDRISGLGLVATRSEPDEPEKAAARLQSREDVLKIGTSTLVESMAARLTDDQSILPELCNVMRRTHPEGVAMAQFAMIQRKDATEWLSQITLPIVVIAGAKDKIIPEETMRRMALLCSGKYYSSPTSSHMIPIEDPVLVAHALRGTFLNNSEQAQN